MSLEEEMRFGDDASNYYYQHLDLGAIYSGTAKWLDLGINYRHIFEEKNSDWKEDNEPHLNATLKWKLSDFSMNNRLRLGYRNRESAEDFWEYRNEFRVKFPLKFTRFEIQPYTADEIFFDFDKGDLYRNRLYTGISLKLTKNIKGELYYMWQSTELSAKWNDSHVLGTKLKLSF